MNIEHIRTYNRNSGGRAYCISHVYVDGVYSHDAIEDYDRGLDQSMTPAQVAKIKVHSKTAIPTGKYVVNMKRKSPKFSQMSYYKKVCDGLVPCLDPVVGFAGILIHCGKDENSSAGCVIVGKNKVVGCVTETQAVFENLYKRMKEASNRREVIHYTIKRTYKV